MKLVRVLRIDVRGPTGYGETERQTNEALGDLQGRGCTILETPQLIPDGTGFTITSIFYDDPSMKPAFTEEVAPPKKGKSLKPEE